MNNTKDLSVLRHSAAHLLAHAISELYPETKLTIGPATKDGFFYDFLPSQNFKEEDLPILQERMQEISKRNLTLEHKEISKDEARKMYKDNPFKLELIEGIPGETVGLSIQGDFKDLCRGGHVKSTGEIKHFKLTNISGSYWRADRNNQPLQRISGTAFFTEKDLKEYEQRKEDAEKYDHRRLGKQLDLFSFHEEGTGFPFFHPKGQSIINALMSTMRRAQLGKGYREISTPIVLTDELWRRSGHYEHYKDNMYFLEIDERGHAIKPMNCPGSILIYKQKPRSFRELPLKLFEFGKVHRHELSGVLHGLLRVRAFTIDDTHIYCTEDQIESEIISTLDLIKEIMTKFGFESIKVAVSTKPENAMGSDELWEKATNALKDALEKTGIKYKIQEGEGAFYGPKIEISIEDSMGREWQCGTIQVDFFQPENFDLSYIESGGDKKRPVIIHQAVYGSLERFLAILLEHHKGLLPFFISPVQIKILPISQEQHEYAQTIYQKLLNENLRVEIDETDNALSGKIKSAQIEKVPWMLILGKKEYENNTITLRYFNGKQEQNLTLNDLIEKAKSEN
jgi:threonyl-tRNA synthetase